ncbi:type VI secretion system protein TssA [Niveibacterium sp. SC-1]|uniref:type VI secretion system protein TssA n=1 Tax=Niveibacterium sp. SC-1 TaxID=3135646 RepID=UPI00311EB146
MNAIEENAARLAQFEALLAPVSEAAPCGEDLEYSAEFLQLTQAAQSRPEAQYGSTVIPAEGPDWRRVEQQATALLARGKDLRVVALLVRAWTERRGVEGYRDGVLLVADFLDRYWDAIYPRLSEEGFDEADPYPRLNALAPLYAPQGCLGGLRAQTLLGAGGLNLREVEALLEGAQLDLPAYPGGRDRLLGELNQAWQAGHPALLAVRTASEAFERIDARFRDAFGAEDQPDKERIATLFRRIAQAVGADRVEPAPQMEAPADLAVGPDMQTPMAPARPAIPAADVWRGLEIQQREDLTLLIEKLCRYLDRHEPSHPAPILLRRAQRLLQMNFYDIVRDLAPEGVAAIDRLNGPQT